MSLCKHKEKSINSQRMDNMPRSLSRQAGVAKGMDRALVIDDDDGLRAVVASHLADQGYDVVQASDATRALSAIDHTPLDLVVLDVDLPGVDGFDVLRQLRRVTDAPVIVITTRS